MKRFSLVFLVSLFCFFPFQTLMSEEPNEKNTDDELDIVVAQEPEKKVMPVAKGRIERSVIMPDFNEMAFYKQRQIAVKSLIDKGVEYFKANDEVSAFRAFTYDKKFVDRELYLFVYDISGACLAHGDQSYLIWKNLYDYRDSFGNYVVRLIIQKAQNGGGWVTYEWKNSNKISYVTEVKKGEKSYIIGCGFYSHSKKDAVVNLVNGAAEHFKDVINQGGSVEEVFGKFNYSLGNFVVGDLYIFALDFDGNIMAQGDMPGLIGQNVIEHKDENGKYINKTIIEKLKTSSEGVWVKYISKNAPKETYAIKATDKKGKNYFIACGFYPTADREAAVDLVRQGYRYMKMHGISQSLTEFTSKTSKGFRYGDLFLFLYDMKGNLIAHGGNPDIVGKNHYEQADDDGKYYVQEMIFKAESGGGWIDYKTNRASRFVYVELVEIGQKKFVIGCGINPLSKPETMQLLVKSGASLLKDSTREEAFSLFISKGGDFVRGDLSLFAFDFNGICYAYEENPNYIWRDLINAKDDTGDLIVKRLIETAKSGAAVVNYKLGASDRIAYIERVDKDEGSYVVGSSFHK